MKIAVTTLLAATLVCAAAPTSNAEPHQVIQGTQVHLTLLSGISTAVAKDGGSRRKRGLHRGAVGTVMVLSMRTSIPVCAGSSKSLPLRVTANAAYSNSR